MKPSRAGGTLAVAVALIIVVVALGAIQQSVSGHRLSRPPHWINVPANLRQTDIRHAALEVLRTPATNDVWLGASSASRPFNRCDWWYRLEVEVRPAGETFQFEPTHFGDWIPRAASRDPLTFPLVSVSGLAPATRYRWIARERVQPFTEYADDGGGVRCEPGELRASAWKWHHVPFAFSFRTPE